MLLLAIRSLSDALRWDSLNRQERQVRQEAVCERVPGVLGGSLKRLSRGESACFVHSIG